MVWTCARTGHGQTPCCLAHGLPAVVAVVNVISFVVDVSGIVGVEVVDVVVAIYFARVAHIAYAFEIHTQTYSLVGSSASKVTQTRWSKVSTPINQEWL